MTITREEPPLAASERRMLEGWLEFHRATLLRKCEGLSPEQLKQRAVPPSNLSLLGLVRHLVEVERHWFVHMMRGPRSDVGVFWTADDPDGDFDNVDAADAAADLATFESTLQEARAAAAEFDDLDAESAEASRSGKHFSLRWIYIHMIEEYARHNGHADLLRESVDGVTGE